MTQKEKKINMGIYSSFTLKGLSKRGNTCTSLMAILQFVKQIKVICATMLLRVTILALCYESLMTGNEDQGKQQQIERKK